MNIQAGTARGWAAALAPALAVALAGTGAVAASAAAGAPGPDSAVVRTVSRPAQQAARAYWTPARMAAATPMRAGLAGRPASPPGIPSPTHFPGVPTVGALFFTTETQAHFCTASVVRSKPGNLVLTAAHCVYGSTYASNIAYVPQYHHGKQPYGAWPVTAIVVAAGWRHAHNPNLDFAFLSVAPPSGTRKPVQQVTGGLRLGINLGYSHQIEVIGYNNVGHEAIGCATSSVEFRLGQMKFFCHDFQDGTSGGPWIIGYQSGGGREARGREKHSHRGTGTVFGVIGGYHQGGDHPWASYSAYFSTPVRKLFLRAQQQ